MADIITETQKKVLGFVSEFTHERGYPPTLREIGRSCGIPSTGSVVFHLRALEARGLLRRAGRTSRGLELLSHPFRLPILRRVGSGGRVLEQEDVEGYMSLDKGLIRGAHFLLKVPDEGMSEVGIREGDLVQVRRQQDIADGDVVVAAVKEEAVVKIVRKQGLHWFLESAHPDYPAITKDFKVIGKVVGLFRSYERR